MISYWPVRCLTLVQQAILVLPWAEPSNTLTLQRLCSISAVSLSILWLMPSNFLLQLRDTAQESDSFLPVLVLRESRGNLLEDMTINTQIVLSHEAKLDSKTGNAFFLQKESNCSDVWLGLQHYRILLHYHPTKTEKLILSIASLFSASPDHLCVYSSSREQEMVSQVGLKSFGKGKESFSYTVLLWSQSSSTIYFCWPSSSSVGK